MNAGAMTSRRPASRAVAAATPKRGHAMVVLAAAMLVLLMAPGCREDEDYLIADTSHWRNPCHGPFTTYRARDLFFHWTPDGSHLLFSADSKIWILETEGARLQQVADTYVIDDIDGRIRSWPKTGFYADVSPDGSRIVYSTCEYPDGGYELASVDIDGTNKRRLTRDGHFEHYPVWSPDGRKIAFIDFRFYSDPTLFNWDPSLPVMVDTYPSESFEDEVKLSVLPMESGARRLLSALLRRGGIRRLEATSGVDPSSPPVWSPDSDHLAFIANEGERRPFLHTVRSDGSKLTRIGETTAPPTWSPDGGELVYAAVDGDEPALYAVRPDGTGRRLIWSGRADEGFAPISEVLWSPDGSEILFLSNELYLVRPDGGGLRRLGIPRHVPDARAAWSPDGSRIAIYYPYQQIVTVSRDGAEVLIHAQADIDQKLPPRERSEPYPRAGFRALDPPLAIALPYRPACSSAVPDPDANPGLVRDCETLLRIRTALFGLGPAGTGRQFKYGVTGSAWAEDMPIGTWTAVSVGGAPPRVRELLLGGEARGAIPPDIARLEMLEVLDTNDLTGPIPPELGRLTHLKELFIDWNLLRGGIPPELGALKNLAILNLAGNSLSGGIPPELGALKNLAILNLAGNSLSGGIPPELGALKNLAILNLAGNSLSGGIPPELGALKNLAILNLAGNSLSGGIPPELGALKNLTYLGLSRNYGLSGDIPAELGGLTRLETLNLPIGCIPVELPALWLKASGLERCKPEGEDDS